MKFGVIQFPGSNCDQDCLAAVNGIPGLEAEYAWHKNTSLDGYDAIAGTRTRRSTVTTPLCYPEVFPTAIISGAVRSRVSLRS